MKQVNNRIYKYNTLVLYYIRIYYVCVCVFKIDGNEFTKINISFYNTAEINNEKVQMAFNTVL